MLLSIIIPVYNAAGTLERCIKSIQAQRMKDYEVLLIDDGSLDTSGELCNSLAAQDSQIRVFHQENAGASAARNKGLDNARGEWICFIDADDLIQGDYFPDSFDDNIDMYLQNELIDGEDQYQKMKITPDGTVLDKNSFLHKFAHTSVFRGVCSKFCKTKIIRDCHVRFINGQRVGEDVLFFMDYIQACRYLSFLDGGAYIYILSKETWGQKYMASPIEAEFFYTAFLQRYHAVGLSLPKLAKDAYSLYSYLLEDTVKTTLWWKFSPIVLAMRKEMLPLYKPRYRIKYHLATCFSAFYAVFRHHPCL